MDWNTKRIAKAIILENAATFLLDGFAKYGVGRMAEEDQDVMDNVRNIEDEFLREIDGLIDRLWREARKLREKVTNETT